MSHRMLGILLIHLRFYFDCFHYLVHIKIYVVCSIEVFFDYAYCFVDMANIFWLPYCENIGFRCII